MRVALHPETANEVIEIALRCLEEIAGRKGRQLFPDAVLAENALQEIEKLVKG